MGSAREPIVPTLLRGNATVGALASEERSSRSGMAPTQERGSHRKIICKG